MNKNLALRVCRKHNKKIKLNWWSNQMYIWYDKVEKCFKSGGNAPVDLNFLQDGIFEILPSNDKYLGGLFNLGG
jgi:hypothetical protein